MRLEHPIPRASDTVGSPPVLAPVIGGGRYALVAKIDEGGMAAVYRAWDGRIGVWRAIKVLLPEYASRRTLRARFEAEAHTMARIDHPNVVQVFDVRTAEVLPYLVMELAAGGTLSTWLEEHRRMPPRLACTVILQVAAGLGAAHAHGVVHRDVKPKNVLVTRDGRCKITDFGIARVDGAEITRTGSTLGTVGYMAPEQRSDAKLVDARADVYSLGAVLYKLLTGVIVSDLFLVEHEPVLLAEIPPPLRPVIVAACRYDRDARTPDVVELVTAITEAMTALPPDPPETPPLARRDAPGERAGTTHAFFPEIAELLQASAEETARSTPPSADTPFTISPSARAAAPGSVSDSVAPLALRREPPDTLRVLASTAVATWLVLMVLGAAGSWDVWRQAASAEAARDALYHVIVEEDAILSELGAHGAQPDEVAALGDAYAAFVEADGSATRQTAALLYARGIDAAAARLLSHDPTNLTSVRAARIAARLRAWGAAEQEWLDTSRMPHGRFATVLGLAPTP